MKKVFLGIGTNLGRREENLKQAIVRIGENIGKVVRVSSVYETEPWGFVTEDRFLNMVAEVETMLTPSGLLGAVLMIESQLGRLRGEEQYSSRLIDIDILFYEDLIIDEISLKIPHPQLHKRKFVLVPLSEIAPDFMHPVLKKNIAALLNLCEDMSQVRLQDCKTLRPQDN
jgi:2-amino-4-hydroxy-6-hydroxymethyldihydropteridine diphosphokinase